MKRQNIQTFFEKFFLAGIVTLAVFFSILIIALNIVRPFVSLQIEHSVYDSGQQFVHLANSFLRGHLYFTHDYDLTDEPTFYNNHAYYALGPLPAIVLMPFVAVSKMFGFFFYSGYLFGPLFFFTVYLAYRLALRLHYEKRDAFILALAFSFVSPLVFVAYLPITSYVAHVLVVLLLLLALYEYYGKRRYWLIGALLGLVLLGRFTAALGIIFFILVILSQQNTLKQKMKDLFRLLFPFAIAVMLLALYNWLRFRNVFDTGYATQHLPFAFQDQLRAEGLFSLKHFATNARHMLFGLPADIGKSLVPIFWNNPDGISIFITSLYLLYFFRIKKFLKEELFLIVTCVITALPLLLSWSSGFYQIGYRFSLDFFPLLFVALMLAVQRRYYKLPFGFLLLTFGSIVINYYLLSITFAQAFLAHAK